MIKAAIELEEKKIKSYKVLAECQNCFKRKKFEIKFKVPNLVYFRDTYCDNCGVTGMYKAIPE